MTCFRGLLKCDDSLTHITLGRIRLSIHEAHSLASYMGPEQKSATLPADPTIRKKMDFVLISWYLHTHDGLVNVILDDTIQLLACSSKVQTTTTTTICLCHIHYSRGCVFALEMGGRNLFLWNIDHPFHHSNTHLSWRPRLPRDVGSDPEKDSLYILTAGRK